MLYCRRHIGLLISNTIIRKEKRIRVRTIIVHNISKSGIEYFRKYYFVILNSFTLKKSSYIYWFVSDKRASVHESNKEKDIRL